MRHLLYWAALTAASVGCLWLLVLNNARMGLI